MEAPFDLGWPYLRTLTEEAVTPAVAKKHAKKLLQTNDPFWPKTAFPRDIARRYLRGYPVRKAHEQTDEIKAAIGGDEPVDLALLQEVLRIKLGPSTKTSTGFETYDFRLAEVIFLFEAFLGTELVAETLVDHLVAARENPRWWGDSFFQDHDNATARRLVPVLGWLRLRMPAARWTELVARLPGEAAKLPGFSDDLRTLTDDLHPITNVRNPAWIAMQRRDRDYLSAHLERTKKWGYWDAQLFHVLGRDRLQDVDLSTLKRLAKWEQLQVIEHFGAMDHPAAERVIRGLLVSRSAGAAAHSWLEAHGHRAEVPAVPTPKQLRAQLDSLLGGLGEALAKLGGDREQETAALKAAFTLYTELRAALGDDEPDAYFTHNLGDASRSWTEDKDAVKRWFEIAGDTCY